MDEILIPGERVMLRPWRRDDIPALLRHADDEGVARNMTDVFPHPYTAEDADAWLTITEQESSRGTIFAIEFEGEAVGGIGYHRRNDVYRLSASIGYWLGRAHWGKGLATESLGLLTAQVFDTTELVRLDAEVFAWNPASGRVLEKCGYTFEGRRRSAVSKAGEVIDSLAYANVRSAQ